jgi:uncharacterized protein
MRIYLDSSAIIYGLEGRPRVRDEVVRAIETAEASDGVVLTSQLSRLECRVKPLRDGNELLLARYDAFFTRPGLVLLDVHSLVLDHATDLRAKHGFKTPDAIHLATALLTQAERFLTGDGELKKCAGIDIAILDPGPGET